MTEEKDIITWQRAAAYIGVTTRTLARWHAEGIGPPRIKIKRRIFYSMNSLEEWLRAHESKPCRS